MMNPAFDKAALKAETCIVSPRKTKKLLDAAIRILSSGNPSLLVADFAEKVKALVRMLRCYAAREYRDIPWQSILLITAALIYFVSPFDAIADFIPLIGFSDDIAVISLVFSAISHDVEKFIAWESAKQLPTELTSS